LKKCNDYYKYINNIRRNPDAYIEGSYIDFVFLLLTYLAILAFFKKSQKESIIAVLSVVGFYLSESMILNRNLNLLSSFMSLIVTVLILTILRKRE
jgi:glycerol-3-phosphate acyltransferase PlsY